MARFLQVAVLLLFAGMLLAQAKPTKGSDQKNPATTQAQVSPDDMVILINGACRTPPLEFAVRGCIRGVTRQEFEELIQVSDPNATPEVKQQLADRLGKIIVLSNEAKKRDLVKDPAVQQYLKFVDMQVLANLLLSKTLKEEATKQATDEAVQAYYEAHVPDFGTADLVRIAIQKKTDETTDALAQYADALRSRCASGEDMAKLQAEANQRAGQPAAAPVELKGQREQALPANQRSVFLLKQGECSVVSPGDSQRMIYKLVARTTIPLERVRPAVVAAIESEYIKSELEKLTKDNIVSLNNKYFNTAPAKPANPSK